MKLIPKLLGLVILLISCQDNSEPQPINEKLPKATFTTLGNEPNLYRALDQAGMFLGNNESGRLMIGITEFESDSILKVIQADSIEYSYTLSLESTASANSFKNLVFSRYSNGFLAYVLEYVSDKSLISFESFTGVVRKYDLEGSLLDEVSLDKVNLLNENSRTMACFADTELVCVSGGEYSAATGIYLECLQWELVITIDCLGSSGGSGGATGGWYNLGTYIPDPNGGTGSAGGSGGSTPPDGEPNFEGSVGVIPPTLTNREALEMVLAEDPFFLINIPCDQLPNWQNVALHTPPQTVLDKLNSLSQDQSIWPGLVPYYGWSVQNLNSANGTVVNMDYYSVTVNQLPGGETAPQLLEYIRKNINSFIDPTKADFEPFSNAEYNIWQSSNYLGSIIHIDMGNDNTWGGGYNIVDQPDDGSVICSRAQNDNWMFTTITAPGDGEHPVSGNRQFGFIQNRNGSYTFFTRGVDRLTGTLDQWYSDVTEWRQQNEMGGKTPFQAGDDLWKSFQGKIQEYINSNGGNSVTNPVVQWQPDWSKVDDYLQGTVSITTMGCK